MFDQTTVTPRHFYLLGAGLIGTQVSEPTAKKEPLQLLPARPERAPAPDAVSDGEEDEDTEPSQAIEEPPGPELVVVQAKAEEHKRPEIPARAFDRPVLCFDTETAGLKPPAICQLAYQLYRDGNVTYYDKILQLTDGVKIDKRASAKHGITDAMAAAGHPAGSELLKFWELVQEVYAANGTVFGHNVQFDVRAFNVTAKLHGLTKELDAAHMSCTMKMSSSRSTLKNKAGHRKAFTLKELYAALHDGHAPTWARLHNAGDDVHVTLACYYKGLRKGWW